MFVSCFKMNQAIIQVCYVIYTCIIFDVKIINFCGKLIKSYNFQTKIYMNVLMMQFFVIKWTTNVNEQTIKVWGCVIIKVLTHVPSLVFNKLSNIFNSLTVIL